MVASTRPQPCSDGGVGRDLPRERRVQPDGGRVPDHDQMPADDDDGTGAAGHQA